MRQSNGGFSGFPPEGLLFLKSLKRINRREWFQPRKEIFETSLKAPMVALVDAINGDLAKVAPSYVTDVKKAIFRIYRDTRFSHDKTPPARSTSSRITSTVSVFPPRLPSLEGALSVLSDRCPDAAPVLLPTTVRLALPAALRKR